MTSFLLLVIKYVFRVPLRMSEEMLLIGDDAVHGEDAYTFTDTIPTVDSGRDTDLELGNAGVVNDGDNGAPSKKQS